MAVSNRNKIIGAVVTVVALLLIVGFVAKRQSDQRQIEQDREALRIEVEESKRAADEALMNIDPEYRVKRLQENFYESMKQMNDDLDRQSEEIKRLYPANGIINQE